MLGNVSQKAHWFETVAPTDKHSMVSFVRLKRQLFQRLEALFSQSIHLSREDNWCRLRRVDTVCLDRDHTVSFVLQEGRGVDAHDTRLVGLSDIREDDID